MAHEGWHAVQQMQGRVKPTMQAQGVSINDDKGLEQEADVMGAKALQMCPNDQSPMGSMARHTNRDFRAPLAARPLHLDGAAAWGPERRGARAGVAPGPVETPSPHEAWHVEPQKNGQVKPPRHPKDPVNIPDDDGLENEAVVMGAAP